MTRFKIIIIYQVAILLAGMVFVWEKFLSQLVHFETVYGTIFRIQGNTIPNPFLTPCFLGSLGYLVAVFLAVRLMQSPAVQRARYLRNFLLAAVLFGVSVISIEAAQYYHVIGGVSVSCTPGASPWATPCFAGTIIFIVSYIISIFIARNFIRGTYDIENKGKIRDPLD